LNKIKDALGCMKGDNMVKDLESGIRVVTLGEGNTKVSQCIPNNCTYSNGILFCNELPNQKGETPRFHGDEVIISIMNMNGALAYIKAIIELLKTWNLDEKDQLTSLANIIEEEIRKEK